jgi:hypothetical protein
MNWISIGSVFATVVHCFLEKLKGFAGILYAEEFIIVVAVTDSYER